MRTKLARLFDKKEFKEVFAVQIKTLPDSKWAWHVVKNQHDGYEIAIYKDKESAEKIRAEYRKLK